MNNKGYFLVDALMFIVSVLVGFISLFFAIDLDEGVTIGGFILFPVLIMFVIKMIVSGSEKGDSSSSKKGDDKK